MGWSVCVLPVEGTGKVAGGYNVQHVRPNARRKSGMDKFRTDEGQKLESTGLADERMRLTIQVRESMPPTLMNRKYGVQDAHWSMVGATWQQPTGKPPPHHPPAPASTGLILRLFITGRSQLPVVMTDTG